MSRGSFCIYHALKCEHESLDGREQWHMPDFFKRGGGFNIACMPWSMPRQAWKSHGGGGVTFFFPSSKFLGQFSRHGVGVSIVHHQPLWQGGKNRSSDPRGGYPSKPPPPPKKKKKKKKKKLIIHFWSKGGGGLNTPPPPPPAYTPGREQDRGHHSLWFWKSYNEDYVVYVCSLNNIWMAEGVSQKKKIACPAVNWDNKP